MTVVVFLAIRCGLVLADSSKIEFRVDNLASDRLKLFRYYAGVARYFPRFDLDSSWRTPPKSNFAWVILASYRLKLKVVVVSVLCGRSSVG